MPKLLTKLKLSELSLVDKPANPLAMAPIFKRFDSNGETMEKELEEVKKALEDLQTSHDKVKAQNEFLRKSLLDNDFVIEADKVTKKQKEEQVSVEGVMVNKSDIPAPVLKALQAAQEKEEMAQLRKRATETLPHFDVEVASALLKNIEGKDNLEKMVETLKAADAAFAAAMTEMGATTKADDMDDKDAAQDKFDDMVKSYASEHKVNKAVAYAEVQKSDEGQKLFKKFYRVKD